MSCVSAKLPLSNFLIYKDAGRHLLCGRQAVCNSLWKLCFKLHILVTFQHQCDDLMLTAM